MSKRDWLIIGQIILSEVKLNQESLFDFLYRHNFGHIVLEIDYRKCPPSMALSHVTADQPEYHNERERLWWQRTIEDERNARRGIVIRAWIPGMDGVKSWVRVSSKKNSKNDAWICNVMPDGKTPIPEFLFIHSGKVEVDSSWNMMKDIEC
jgi:hypothetical protein